MALFSFLKPGSVQPQKKTRGQAIQSIVAPQTQPMNGRGSRINAIRALSNPMAGIGGAYSNNRYSQSANAIHRDGQPPQMVSTGVDRAGAPNPYLSFRNPINRKNGFRGPVF